TGRTIPCDSTNFLYTRYLLERFVNRTVSCDHPGRQGSIRVTRTHVRSILTALSTAVAPKPCDLLTDSPRLLPLPLRSTFARYPLGGGSRISKKSCDTVRNLHTPHFPGVLCGCHQGLARQATTKGKGRV